MLRKYITIGLMAGALIAFQSCTIDEAVDLNNPSVNDVLSDPTVAELNNLVVGVMASMREDVGVHVTAMGTIAREFYIFDADPRNTEDLLGKDGVSLDNNSFYSTASFASRYQVVKLANIILEAVEEATVLSEEQKNGYRGFANTVKAHELLMVLNQLYDNGIRIDVSDPLNLGGFVTRAEAEKHIADLLDTGATQLTSAGSDFAFTLTSGYAGFDKPATFRTFNRAVAARVALYRGEYDDVLNIMDESFMDMSADLSIGPKHVFSTQGGDMLNPLFKVPGQNGDQIVVHESFVEDAEMGDMRVAKKTILRTDPTVQDNLTGSYSTALFTSATAPMDIIRNEELLLIKAEAYIQLSMFDEAIELIDVVRTKAGLTQYSGEKTKDAMVDQILYERRYSLWGEYGHRMIDLRRYGKLNSNELPLDRAKDQIFTQFPIPLTENQG
ncbi:RagB/SusD family nutrient uptake outer membrane protein [Limibacter armeniacum]|uniref:RagB/SusD family nutrient uptake outer membrane protein n=1 Tax=Limibacter armeniacum TaxID=466084 RepID=UPI002FE510CE